MVDISYLSLAEAAKEFEMSQNYLRFLIFKKKLHGVKIGRNWVTTRAWMELYLSGRNLTEDFPSVSQENDIASASKKPLDLLERSSLTGLAILQVKTGWIDFTLRMPGPRAKHTGAIPSRIILLPLLLILSYATAASLGFTPFEDTKRFIAGFESTQYLSKSDFNNREKVILAALDLRTPFQSVKNNTQSLFHNTRSQIAISQNPSSPPFENLSSTAIGEGRLGATPPFEKGRLGGIFAFTLPSLHLPKFSLPSLSFSLAPLRSFFTPLEIGRLKTTVKSLMGFSELFKSSPPPPSEIAIPQNPSSPPFENLSSTVLAKAGIGEGRLGATPPFEKGRLGGISLPEEAKPSRSPLEVSLPGEVRPQEVIRIVERREEVIPSNLASIKSSLLSDLASLNQSLKNEMTQDLSSLRSLYSRLSSENQSQSRVITLTQKIDTLGEATLSNITFSGTGNQFNLKDADIPDDITVSGAQTFSNLTVTSALTSNAAATSTFSGGIKATALDITSATATSTFANGLQLQGGCFRTSTGTCLTPASPGGANTAIQFNSNSTFGGDENNLLWDNTLKRLGLGTTTPASLLSVQGNTQISGTSTQGALIATSTLFVGTAGQFFNVLSNGLVGIGTTSPGSLLSIHGGNLQVTGTSTTNALIATSTLFVGSTGQLFNVLQNGLVGIGTTSPGSLLSVHGGNAQITGTSTASAIIATSTLFVGQSGSIFNVLQSRLVGIGTTSPSSLLSIHGNTLVSATTTTGSLIATSTLYVGSQGQRLLIAEQGNIGIGTTSPSSLLSIQGIANFVSAATSTLYTTLSLPNLYSTSTTATSTFAGSLYVASSTPGGNALFAVGTSSASALLWIDRNSGNVGIGSSSPTKVLSIDRPVPSGYVASIINNLSSGSGGGLYIQSRGSAATDYGLRVDVNETTSGLVVNNAGNVGIGDTAPEGTQGLTINQGANDNTILALKSSDVAVGGNLAETDTWLDIKKHTATTGGARIRGHSEDAVGVYLHGIVTNASTAKSTAATGAVEIDGTIYSAGVEGNIPINGNILVIRNSSVAAFIFDKEGTGHADDVWTDNAFDLAEEYDIADKNAEEGDIVVIDPSINDRMMIASSKDQIPSGAISYHTAQLGSSFGNIREKYPQLNLRETYDNPQPVALVGRVPVKVSTENGPIKIGDHIAISSIRGTGMKAAKDGYTVGMALESFDGENATTTAEIQCSPSTSSGTNDCSWETKIVKTGKILVFVNLGYSKLDDGISQIANGETRQADGGFTGWTIDQTTGKVTAAFTAGLDLKGNSLENVSKILSANGRWSIDEQGKLAVKEIESEKLKVKNEAEFQGKGITLYASDGNPYCVKVEVGGAVVSTPGKCSE